MAFLALLAPLIRRKSLERHPRLSFTKKHETVRHLGPCTNALYAPPLMRAMSASCSALTRNSDSYSTCRRSSSRCCRARRGLTAESRLRRSTRRRLVALAHRACFALRRRRLSPRRVRFRVHGRGARVSERNRRGRYATRDATRRRNTRAVARNGGDERPKVPVPPTRHTKTTYGVCPSPRRPRKKRRETCLSVTASRWRPYR